MASNDGCVEEIWRGFSHYACGRKRWKDDRCKTHHPEAREARRVARGPTQYERECQARNEHDRKFKRLKNRVAEFERIARSIVDGQLTEDEGTRGRYRRALRALLEDVTN